MTWRSREAPGKHTSDMTSRNGHTLQMRTNEMVEQNNDEMVEQMSSKIKQLKSLSIDIGDEMRNQNRELDGMGADFETTGGLLGSSFKRVKNMANAGHNRWILYMTAFVVLAFLVLYYIIRWRT